jgi:hypothetical protein
MSFITVSFIKHEFVNKQHILNNLAISSLNIKLKLFPNDNCVSYSCVKTNKEKWTGILS